MTERLDRASLDLDQFSQLQRVDALIGHRLWGKALADGKSIEVKLGAIGGKEVRFGFSAVRLVIQQLQVVREHQHQVSDALHQHLCLCHGSAVGGGSALSGQHLGGRQGRDEVQLPQHLICGTDARKGFALHKAADAPCIQLLRNFGCGELCFHLPVALGGDRRFQRARNVVLPIAGIILTFIACYELIEMITQHNNMAQFEPALLMKWIFKTAISVWMSSNTFDIIMAVFDVTQQVVANSSGIISGNTRVNDIGLSMLQSSMMQMDVGPLFGLFLQSFFIGITMRILSIVIFVIVYGRMIEIHMAVSLAPIPMATWGNHEQSHVGQNYLRSLFALGFQGFLILICVAIYAVLLQNVAFPGRHCRATRIIWAA